MQNIPDELSQFDQQKEEAILETLSAENLEQCLSVLDALRTHPQLCLEQEGSFLEIQRKASQLVKAVKKCHRQESTSRDQEWIDQTSIRQGRIQITNVASADHLEKLEFSSSSDIVSSSDNFSTSDHLFSGVKLSEPRHCYICKQNFHELHEFYDAMCPSCAKLNWSKRNQSANLQGKVAFLTGGRMKIGFQIALKLLRSGATLHLTTRFPLDAAERFSQQEDFNVWNHRLRIHGIDFRHLPSVKQLCRSLVDELPKLDLLINNAAQTIRRPPAFYQHLLEKEAALNDVILSNHPQLIDLTLLESTTRFLSAKSLAHAVTDQQKSVAEVQEKELIELTEFGGNQEDFPLGQYDFHGQQVDRRSENTWILPLKEVSLPELIEVQVVNSIVPFLLIQLLDPLFSKESEAAKYIVNVSAMEGKFNDLSKRGEHPHTNMAKAALNMITRTSASEYAKRNIYMNSVDTGWVTNEFPLAKTQQMEEDGFQPPLDEIDGAARVLDPIFIGENQSHYLFGKFLKDYREITW